MAENKSQTETYITFTVPGFSKLKLGDTICSTISYVRNLPWNIMVMRSENGKLGFFLQCNVNDEAPTWSCNAVAEFRLHSNDLKKLSFCRKIQHVYNSKQNDWGYENFISWDEVLNPKNGYLKDDMVTFGVYIVTKEPNEDSNESESIDSFPVNPSISDINKSELFFKLETAFNTSIALLENKVSSLEDVLEIKSTERFVQQKTYGTINNTLKELLTHLEVECLYANQYREQVCRLSTRIKILKKQLEEAEMELKESKKNLEEQKSEKRKARRECEEILESQESLTTEIKYLRKKLSDYIKNRLGSVQEDVLSKGTGSTP